MEEGAMSQGTQSTQLQGKRDQEGRVEAPELTSCRVAGSQPTTDCYRLAGAGDPSSRAYAPQQEKPAPGN